MPCAACQHSPSAASPPSLPQPPLQLAASLPPGFLRKRISPHAVGRQHPLLFLPRPPPLHCEDALLASMRSLLVPRPLLFRHFLPCLRRELACSLPPALYPAPTLPLPSLPSCQAPMPRAGLPFSAARCAHQRQPLILPPPLPPPPPPLLPAPAPPAEPAAHSLQ